MQVSPETIFGILTIAVAVWGIGTYLWPKSRPLESFFRCAGCKTVTRHSERTVEAWRRKKTRFYCPTCHSR